MSALSALLLPELKESQKNQLQEYSLSCCTKNVFLLSPSPALDSSPPPPSSSSSSSSCYSMNDNDLKGSDTLIETRPVCTIHPDHQARHVKEWTSPFVINPLSIIVRPTILPRPSRRTNSENDINNDNNDDYAWLENNALLHVGISNADATGVYNLDQRGVCFDPILSSSSPSSSSSSSSSSWDPQYCISIPINHQSLENDELEQFLQLHHQDESPSSSLYSGAGVYTANNCFSFVVRFFNKIQLDNKDDHNKLSIADAYVQPAMAAAQAYRRILGFVRKEGKFVTENLPSSSPPTRTVRLCDYCSCQIGSMAGMTAGMTCQECTDFDLCLHCFQKQREDNSVNTVHTDTHHVNTHVMTLCH